MSDLRTAAQQVLEAYDSYDPLGVVMDILRAALAQPEPRNQCGETCERAKLCAVCARGLEEQEQEPVLVELRRLHAANLKLAGAIDMIRETLQGGNVDDLLYIINTALDEHRRNNG